MAPTGDEASAGSEVQVPNGLDSSFKVAASAILNDLVRGSTAVTNHTTDPVVPDASNRSLSETRGTNQGPADVHAASTFGATARLWAVAPAVEPKGFEASQGSLPAGTNAVRGRPVGEAGLDARVLLANALRGSANAPAPPVHVAAQTSVAVNGGADTLTVDTPGGGPSGAPESSDNSAQRSALIAVPGRFQKAGVAEFLDAGAQADNRHDLPEFRRVWTDDQPGVTAGGANFLKEQTGSSGRVRDSFDRAAFPPAVDRAGAVNLPAGAAVQTAGTERTQPGLSSTSAGEARQPSPSDAEPSAGLGNQIVRSVRMAWRDGGGEALIRLHPEDLGEVLVTVKVSRGEVLATLRSAAPEVRTWLEEHSGVLKNALAQQGLHLDDLVVTDEGGSNHSRDGSQPDRQPRSGRGRVRAGLPEFDPAFRGLSEDTLPA